MGASPAGLAAAIVAAKGGAEVTLLEAKPQIGIPPSPAILGYDSLWPKQFDRPAHTTRRRLKGTKVRDLQGKGFFLNAPLTIFDRTRFDPYLAAEAEKAGARIITGVKGLEALPDRTLVAEGLELKPEVLLFADGARTQATRFIPSTRDPNAVQWGAALEFEAPEDATNEWLYMTAGSHAPGGRSQLTPLGNNRWSHWTFFRGNPAGAEAAARRAFALDVRLMGWSLPEARFTGVGPDPLYTLPGKLVGEGVMAAGGAAGQGGLEVGLEAGALAGEVAARVLRGEGRLEEYEERWNKKFNGFYERLRSSNDMMIRLTDEETSALMAAWDGKHLGGKWALFRLLSNPRGVLAFRHARRITKDRPTPELTLEPQAPVPVAKDA